MHRLRATDIVGLVQRDVRSCRVRFVLIEHDALATAALRIRRALEDELFVLHGQPVIDLASGEVSHHELLIRMRDDDGSLIAPGAFLPTAERFGLVNAIDRWVAGAAVSELTDSATDRHVVRAVVGIARSLDKRTVAEGVENAETLAIVRELGVDYVQGFHTGRPRHIWPEPELEAPARAGIAA